MLQEHLNFVGNDEALGPVLLSVKSENVAGQEHTRLLLRLKSGTVHSAVATAAPHNMIKVTVVVPVIVELNKLLLESRWKTNGTTGKHTVIKNCNNKYQVCVRGDLML